MSARRRLGSEVEPDGTRFALFTDSPHAAVQLVDAGGGTLAEHALEPLGDGYFEGRVAGVGHGARYRFVVGGRALPDPYARFLPDGVHGPAMVVEPRHAWRHECVSRPLGEHVIYELHVGAFTPEGTYASAAERLGALAELGVTTVELMPIAAFDGARGWGYDGVAHFAPFAPYGSPDELRAFVDRAHGLGLAVLLDVVYNHFGPSGNYLSAYSSAYFTRDIPTPWGDAPNFAHPVMRRYVLDNARYWLREFRIDGLRLDATHALVDPSPKHLLAELAEAVAEISPKRYVIAEDDRNQAALVTEYGLDALWADDFHHQVRVTLTGERDGYYGSYEPGVRDLERTVRNGWLYEGQLHPTSNRLRGTSAGSLLAEQLVYCIQNHDQIGNRASGDRLNHRVSTDAYLAATTLLLFLPMTPLLFMGQEWAASTPFAYFTDHEPELGRLVFEGRRREFESFSAFGGAEAVPDPQALETFVASKLRWDERDAAEHARVLEHYRALLALRRRDPVLSSPSRERLRCRHAGGVLVVTRWLEGDGRALLVNFGASAARLDALEPRTGLAGGRRLLASGPSTDGVTLPALAALVLAGRFERSRDDDG